MSTLSQDNSERRTQALTADSIDTLQDAISALQQVAGGDLEVHEAEVTLYLSASDAERVDALVAALSDSVETAPATGNETEADGGKTQREVDNPDRTGRGESKQPLPPLNTVQEPPVDFQGPKPRTIRYAVLCILVARSSSLDGWLDAEDISGDPWCPYDEKQVNGALSALFHRAGAIRRKRVSEGHHGHRLGYRPTGTGTGYVRDTGRFRWPSDGPDIEHPPLHERPYLLADEEDDGGDPSAVND